ncbi:PIN-like domain-containing protein [Paenibacillus sp. Leaf72]|uniref:PIN-like domain-containing protein n=1 Tax=Paenibacillus sp. Leaf72 TaxID=1736234 RepID=UPI000B2718AC
MEARTDRLPDTNAILDLYRYSSTTSQYVLDILIRISEHVWITNQVNAEYLKHYRGVIEREKIKYHDVTNQVHLITQKAKNDIINRFHQYKGFLFRENKVVDCRSCY